MSRPDLSRPDLSRPDLSRVNLTRRRFHALLLGAAGLCTAGLGRGGRIGAAWADAANPALGALSAGALPQPSTAKYFTALGAGDHSGSSWANAMPIQWLSRSLNLGEAGTAYFIGFDDSPHSTVAWMKPVAYLKNSGAPGNPLRIGAGYLDPAGGQLMAAEAARAKPEARSFFASGRQLGDTDMNPRKSPRCVLSVQGGASHVVLSGFRLEGAGPQGLIMFNVEKDQTQAFADIVIRDIVARNVGRVIETAKGAQLANVTVENCSAKGIVRGFARFWNLKDSILRNLDLDADHQDGGLSNPCQLLALAEGSNVTFENVTLKNAYNKPKPNDKPGKSYVQGDGIVCERKTRDITIRNCHASGMGDGGFDVKTTNVTIEDSSAEACKFGARIWSESDNVVRRCRFVSPAPIGMFTTGCIQASGRLSITDTTLEAGPGTCGIQLHRLPKQDAPHVVMKGGSITVHDGAQLVVGPPGGILELVDVTVNGQSRTQKIVMGAGNSTQDSPDTDTGGDATAQ
jgi:hypothetical protein